MRVLGNSGALAVGPSSCTNRSWGAGGGKVVLGYVKGIVNLELFRFWAPERVTNCGCSQMLKAVVEDRPPLCPVSWDKGRVW